MEEKEAVEEEEEEEEAAPPPRAPTPPPPRARSKASRNEAVLLQAAIDASLQQPVDPRRLVGTKVCTTSMSLLA